ncbi:MAG TPA: hypothetical protein VFY29_06425 [Terriglobia bacterium]|nr:hypothetical protein [Terriglobia bacterium]
MGGLTMSGETMPRASERGISMVETLIAASVMAVCALGLMAFIGTAIATNTRNRFDSTTTMLAQSVAEQINATVIGSGTANLSDCAGTTFSINTAPGGAALTTAGNAINFAEATPPTAYHMDYVVKSPCNPSGIEQAIYDVRWNVALIGAGVAPTNTYRITIGAQLKNRGYGNKTFAAPFTLRVLLGN